MKNINRTFKRILSVFLAVIMLVGGIPLSSTLCADFSGFILAASAQEEVTVVDVDIPAFEVMEHVDGNWAGTENAEGEPVEYFVYNVSIWDVDDDVTVYFSDGTSLTDYWGNIEKAIGVEFKSDFTQDMNNQLDVGTHSIGFTLGDYEGEYTVVVTENPIESFSVAPVDCVEKIDGWYIEGTYKDEETEQGVPYKYFYYDVDYNELLITVNLSNGEVVEGNAYDMHDLFGCYPTLSTDQEYDNPWGLGEHTAVLNLLGRDAEFTMNVIEFPINRIEVGSLSFTENTNGNIQTEYWDEVNGEWVACEAFYQYSIVPESITVYYKDENREPETFEGPMEFTDATGFGCSYYDNQSHTAPWGIGTHTAYLQVGEMVVEYSIEITAHPIASISIAPIECIEYVDGYLDSGSYYDVEKDEEVAYSYFHYDIDYSDMFFTVTTADGEVVEGDGNYIAEYFDSNPEVYMNQGPLNPWGLGEHRSTVNLLGKETPLICNVVEIPIDRIEVEPLSFEELCDGVFVYDYYDEELGEYVETEYYKYYTHPRAFTVYYKDENREPETYDNLNDFSENTGYNYEYYDDQCHTNLWGVGTHKAYFKVGKLVSEYDVEIRPHRVASVSVAPIELIEHVDGWIETGSNYDGETGEEVEYSFFHYDISDSKTMFTVTLSDGEVVEGSGEYIAEYFDYNFSITTPQSYENQWGLGEHTATVTVLGKEFDFTVNVVELPIERIEISSLSYTELTNGQRVTEYWDEELEEYVATDYYMYDVYPSDITVYYKDENREPETYNDIWDFSESTGYSYNYYDDQSHNNPWGVGKHTAYLKLGKLVSEYEVEITANPVASISVSPIELIEEVDGWVSSEIYVDEETGEEIERSFFHYGFNYSDMDLVVTLTNGDVIEGDGDYISSYFDFDFGVRYGQSYENQWGVGEHTATVVIMGKEAEMTVNVVELPIERIEIEPFSIREFNDAEHITEYWDENLGDYVETDYYHYYTNPQNITVYYKDENREPETYESISDFADSTGYRYDCYDDQSHNNPWGVGKHTAYLKVGKLVTEYEVEITEHPVDFLSVETVELVQFVNGSYVEGSYINGDGEEVFGEYFHYDFSLADVCMGIGFSDGSGLACTGEDIFELYGEYPHIHLEQSYENQLSLGEHTYTITLLGKEFEGVLKIVENPIERIEIEPLSFMEFTNGEHITEYWDEEIEDYIPVDYYEYYIAPDKITVYYKDENRESETYDSLYHFTENTGLTYDCESDQSHDNPWEAGKHTAYFRVGDYVAEYEVEITASPVKSISVDPIELFYLVNGYYTEGSDYDEDGNEIPYEYFYYDVNEYSLTFHVELTDGTTINGDMDDIYEALEDYPSVDFCQDYENQFILGANAYSVTLLGKTCTGIVNVIENPVERIEVEPLSFMENTNGERLTGYWDDENCEWVETEAYYVYDVNPYEFTVYYKDDRAPEYYDDLWMFTEETGLNYTLEDDQSHETPWGVGTHTAYFKIGEVACEYDVTITEDPVESIVMEPVSVIANYDGEITRDEYWDEDLDENVTSDEYFRYSYSPKKVTVNYKDGTSVTFDFLWELEEEYGWGWNWFDEQSYENQWDVGTHEVEYEIGNYHAILEVEVVESAIESIEAGTIYLCENKGGWYEQGAYEDEETNEEVEYKYYYYSVFNNEFNLKVTLKDGTVIEGTASDVFEDLDSWPEVETDQSPKNPWTSGTHTATFNLLGKLVEVTVKFCSHKKAVEYPELAPLCDFSGYTAGKYCPTCQYWIEGREYIETDGHKDANTDDICDDCGKSISFESYSNILSMFNLFSTPFGSDENVPDETMFFYLVWQGAFDDYYDAEEWSYTVPYDKYIEIADKYFANHSDMVEYFADRDMFTDSTNQTVKWYDGGFGDASDLMLTNVYDPGNGTLVLQGVKLYFGLDESDIDDSYNYYVRTMEYRDRFGDITAYNDYAEVECGYELTIKETKTVPKIISLQSHNFYILDGSLYERIDDDLKVKYDRFEVNCGEGATIVTTEGADGFVEHNDERWFNVGAGYGFDIELEDGYELVSVTFEDNNGKRTLNEFSFGGYSVIPDGAAKLTVETKNLNHTHVFEEVTTRATLTKNGKIQKVCECGEVESSKTIHRPDTIELSNDSYTYNGEAKKPSVTVEDTKGKELKKDTDYTVTYEKGRKNPGRYTVTVKFKGKYSGTKELEFTVKPRKVYDLEAEQTVTTITLSWSESVGADGYRVYQYNSDTDEFEKIADVTGTTYKLKDLKSATKCEFKVRAYVKDDGTIYGSYSDALETATKPKSTSITSVKSTTKGKAKVAWDDVSRESKYQLYYATSKNGTYKRYDNYDANETNATVSGLTSGKTYYFKIRSYKNTDSGKVYSSYSAVKSVKVK